MLSKLLCYKTAVISAFAKFTECRVIKSAQHLLLHDLACVQTKLYNIYTKFIGFCEKIRTDFHYLVRVHRLIFATFVKLSKPCTIKDNNGINTYCFRRQRRYLRPSFQLSFTVAFIKSYHHLQTKVKATIAFYKLCSVFDVLNSMSTLVGFKNNI